MVCLFTVHQSGLKFVPKCADPSKDKGSQETLAGMNQTFVPRQRLLVMFAYDKKVRSLCGGGKGLDKDCRGPLP